MISKLFMIADIFAATNFQQLFELNQAPIILGFQYNYSKTVEKKLWQQLIMSQSTSDHRQLS